MHVVRGAALLLHVGKIYGTLMHPAEKNGSESLLLPSNGPKGNLFKGDDDLNYDHDDDALKKENTSLFCC